MPAYSTSSAQTWSYWTSSSDITTFNSNGSTVWLQWASNSTTSSAITTQYNYQPVVRREPTAAELQEQHRKQEEANRQWEEKRKKEQAEKEAAELKAKELLEQHLSEEQKQEFTKSKKFHVIAKDGNRYEITYGWAGNIREFDKKGKAIARYCIHPRETIPFHDNMLAQKLLLETDPDYFKKTANRTALAG